MHPLVRSTPLLIAAMGVAACASVRGPAAEEPRASAESAGPAQAAPLDWRALVGCYVMGETSERFALDSMPSTFGLGPRAEGGLQTWSYFRDVDSGYWRLLPGDTVEYVVGNSLHGSRFVGVSRGDSLVGHRLPWTDIVGARPRAFRRVAYREPCAPDGSPGAPPPNALVLFDSLPRVVAAVMADSVLPALPAELSIAVGFTDNPHGFSARVASALGAHPRVRDVEPETVFVAWVHATSFHLERDSADALVITSVCLDRPGDNLRETQHRYRFAREESRWRLAGITLVSDVRGVCGPNLRD